jgi:hypothetical protein
MPDLLLYFQKIMAERGLTYKVGFTGRLQRNIQTNQTALPGIMLQLDPQQEPNRISGSDSIRKNSWNAKRP